MNKNTRNTRKRKKLQEAEEQRLKENDLLNGSVAKVNKNVKSVKSPKNNRKSSKTVEDKSAKITEVTFTDNQDIFHMTVDAEEDEVMFREDADMSMLAPPERGNANLNATSVGNRSGFQPARLFDSGATTPVYMPNEAAGHPTPNHNLVNFDVPAGQPSHHGDNMGQMENNQFSPGLRSQRSIRPPAENKFGIDENIQQIIGETIAKTMKQLMMDGRLVMENELTTQSGKNRFNKRKTSMPANHQIRMEESNNNTLSKEILNTQNSLSKLTIYDQAIPKASSNDNSLNKDVLSSSTDEADTSDEALIINTEVDLVKSPEVMRQSLITNQLTPNIEDVIKTKINEIVGNALLRVDVDPTKPDDPQPGTSRGEQTPAKPTSGNGEQGAAQAQTHLTPAQFSEEMMKKSKRKKAVIYDVPGKDMIISPDIPNNFIHSALVDE